jgi:hypothetical protein
MFSSIEAQRGSSDRNYVLSAGGSPPAAINLGPGDRSAAR